jgi:antitoxin component YwqK of YwqJK toxin-antitoxin module
VEYVLNGEVVGVRWFDEGGAMDSDTPFKNGVIHGTQYWFDNHFDGTLRVAFAEPYRSGLAHGTAKQWDGEKPIGTYTMKRGTGLDLWRHRSFESNGYHLTEARYLKDGMRHGFEWWLNEDQETIREENHYWKDLQHGIQREWNSKGRLMRGYPRYWVNNERVSNRQYLRARAKDCNLPSFREADNLPQRKFPSEVLAAIK